MGSNKSEAYLEVTKFSNELKKGKIFFFPKHIFKKFKIKENVKPCKILQKCKQKSFPHLCSA